MCSDTMNESLVVYGKDCLNKAKKNTEKSLCSQDIPSKQAPPKTSIDSISKEAEGGQEESQLYDQSMWQKAQVMTMGAI